MFDGTGEINIDYLYELSGEQYGNPSPQIVYGYLPDQVNERFISQNTDWDTVWHIFHDALQEIDKKI